MTTHVIVVKRICYVFSTLNNAVQKMAALNKGITNMLKQKVKEGNK